MFDVKTEQQISNSQAHEISVLLAGCHSCSIVVECLHAAFSELPLIATPLLW